MRYASATAIAILAIVVGCASPDDRNAGLETGDDNAAVDALFASWDLPGSPGCALAVARDGTLVYSRGYGHANLDYDIPITPQTVFDVASVTKQFVAALANMLALDGKLSLDDDVRKWLPELPEYEWPIALRHLIHHTSGLRDYLNLFPLARAGDYDAVSREQLLAMMSRQRASPSLSSVELAEVAGSFFSAELVATYRFAVVDGSLTVRIEQEPSLQVAPVAEDEFEVRFESRGWAASPARLEFKRNAYGAITGFSLSSGSERDIVFEKRPALDVRTPSSGDPE